MIRVTVEVDESGTPAVDAATSRTDVATPSDEGLDAGAAPQLGLPGEADPVAAAAAATSAVGRADMDGGAAPALRGSGP